MADFPYMQFFGGDWMRDPKLSMCLPATRGFWMDALCAMHADGRAGQLSGTTTQLARACRCLPAEASAAIADLRSTGAADVIERNGVVTLICRRMKREEVKRKSNNSRQLKHRNGGVTPEDEDLSRNDNGDVTDTRALNSESESDEPNGSKNKKARGTQTEISAYITQLGGLPDSDAEWFYDKMLASGWKNDGQPVKDWKATVRTWKRINIFPSQKEKEKQNGTRQRPAAGGTIPGQTDRNHGTANARNTSNYSGVGKVAVRPHEIPDAQGPATDGDADGVGDAAE